ncbi:hypothetical protein ABT215_35950 [Streptomyces sp900105755]|uniref:hypothetical protein n=1 Tax=Streptomyces sp. 900105755 TaxID=3154389 RepID=UPI0033241AAF
MGTGTTVSTVTAGIALLGRLGELEDVPYLYVVGLLRDLTGPAVKALDVLDRRSAAVLWLTVYDGRGELQLLIRILWTGARRAVRPKQLGLTASPRMISSSVACRIAEASQLPDLLDDHPFDSALLARAGCSSGWAVHAITRPTSSPIATRFASTTAS